jgi:hypothetical protein
MANNVTAEEEWKCGRCAEWNPVGTQRCEHCRASHEFYGPNADATDVKEREYWVAFDASGYSGQDDFEDEPFSLREWARNHDIAINGWRYWVRWRLIYGLQLIAHRIWWWKPIHKLRGSPKMKFHRS